MQFASGDPAVDAREFRQVDLVAREDEAEELQACQCAGPIVDGAVVGAVVALLGCQVGDRAGLVVHDSFFRGCAAEIDDLALWRVVGHDCEVSGFDVSVHDAFAVEEFDAFDDLGEEDGSRLLGCV